MDEAKRSGGPVLELGVGTGRIAIPIAQAGVDVIGVDASEGMLAVARAAAAEAGVTERLDLRRGDIRKPPAGTGAPLVICPFRSLLHLQSDPERISTLTAVHDLLPPGGRFVFDVFTPAQDDIDETHGRWLEREPGIFERAEWDTAHADAHTLRQRALRCHHHGARVAFPSGVAPCCSRRAASRSRSATAGSTAGRSPAARTASGSRGARPFRLPLVIWVIVIVVAVVALILLFLVWMYNRLVRLRNRTQNAWAQVDVQLRRRYDLIPNLVESVKGYAAHERGTFDEVTRARTAAQQAQTVPEQAQAENVLTAAIGRLFAVAEAYPQLRATENFQQLQAAAERHGAEDRGLPPGLQRHRPHVQQRDPDGADEHRRRPLPLRAAHVLRDRGSGPGGTTRAVLIAAVAAVALVVVPAALAKEYTLPAAHVSARVTPTGAVDVTERLTFSFDGDFTGAYRDIPIRSGETIDHVGVAEGDALYAPGASAELGSSGSPGTYGTARLSNALRIVWHFNAAFEDRTFTVAYRIKGLAVAYDDVVDVNLKVWGDQWPVGLGELHASTFLPRRTTLGPSYRVWGAPEYVRGAVGRTPTHTKLLAIEIPSKQFVELRTVFPRRLLTSTSGAKVVHGDGLENIVAEQRESAASFESDRRQIQDAKDHPGRTFLILLALGVGPAVLVLLGVYLLFGRERKTTYDREYEQDPPTELEPALVPPLLRERSGVGSNEFTATLFDLIRRGRYKATPVTTEHSTWGGMKKQDVADLEIAKGNGAKLTSFEDDVAEVVDSIVADKPERLSNFRERITADRTGNAARFSSFKKAVATSIDRRNWYDNRGAVIIGAGIAVFAVIAVRAAGGRHLEGSGRSRRAGRTSS